MKKEESIQKLNDIISQMKTSIIELENWKKDFIDFHPESIDVKLDDIENIVGVVKGNKRLMMLFYEKYNCFTKMANDINEYEKIEKNYKRMELIDDMCQLKNN